MRSVFKRAFCLHEWVKMDSTPPRTSRTAPGGETWCEIDGKEYHSDMGYAFEGIGMFVDVLKSRMEDSNDER